MEEGLVFRSELAKKGDSLASDEFPFCHRGSLFPKNRHRCQYNKNRPRGQAFEGEYGYVNTENKRGY
jgi:hypothetical protein